ncbi:hypothetical protein H2201_009273 [Coniosporium apollinis]|uniref:F-box domain-containing protein n=1 Tax=Coniosporium apollinis TaxID=61459 RepID=A0ABQ9NEX2_9PEZI|nr:hypothetical protein H2201_009273 [Coniosporium apollinis]
MIEEYANKKKPGRGEIYRKICLYRLEKNDDLEQQWWSCLSDHEKKNLERLFRHPAFKAAFEALLEIPVHLDGIPISLLHKVMGMGCEEASLCYLNHTKEVWRKLLRGDRQAMQKVDQATVKALELTAPGVSRADAQAVWRLLQGGQIFSNFSIQEREAIWDQVRSIEGLIPTLSSFFNDHKYLEGPADCLRRVMKLSPRETVSTAMERMFSDVNQAADQCVIQVSESSYVLKPGSLADRVEYGKRQMWIAAMRMWDEIPKEFKRKNGPAKPVVKEADERGTCKLAALAYRLGFESDEIRDLMRRSADPSKTKWASADARQ